MSCNANSVRRAFQFWRQFLIPFSGNDHVTANAPGELLGAKNRTAKNVMILFISGVVQHRRSVAEYGLMRHMILINVTPATAYQADVL
jgi:hypothetical protein